MKEKKTLKVILTEKILTYKNEVITKQKVGSIDFEYDPTQFLLTAVKNLSFDNFPKPYTKSFNDLMSEVFNITLHDEVWRPYLVETEPLNNIIKFVFYKHGEGHQCMKWELI